MLEEVGRYQGPSFGEGRPATKHVTYSSWVHCTAASLGRPSSITIGWEPKDLRWARSTSLNCRRAPRRKDHERRGEEQHAHRPELAVLAQQTRRQTAFIGQAQEFFPYHFGLEGEPLSQERSFRNSGAEHRPEPNHSQPTEEVTIVVLTPNRFFIMMTNPGFPSPASNPALFVVTVEAFLGLTSQVQALAGMVQTIVLYLPQLMYSTTHQSAPPTRQVAEAQVASPTPAPARSHSRSYGLVQTGPNFDTLSSDTVDSLREQVHQVYQRLDEIQKDVLKSRGEIGESSKGGSPFTPEIQGKPLPATFRLPILEPYDGSSDPTEHITAFRAQMALYDTSDACTLQIDHRLPLGVGPREQRAPLSVCGTVYLTGPRNSRPPSIPSHPGIFDGTETVEVLLVTDRATAHNATQDAATGASIHGHRDIGGRQVGRDEAPPGGAAPRTPPAATEEEGG
ncbi:hypothetical protein BHE74_00041943 [Ensete ventricosum]|nr:hypothetical protein BHE74_00041943 [Ensete ventricosum]